MIDQRHNVLRVERIEITAETIGGEIAAGYPEDAAGVFLAMLETVEAFESTKTWPTMCRRIACKLPEAKLADVANMFRTLAVEIDDHRRKVQG